MNPSIRETCVRAGNTGFIFTLTFILFVLCGEVNLLNASDAQPALSDDLTLVLEYSMEESDHTTDKDTFAVELLYAF
tara:strand:- start:164 stop:394 length:231 start_codon:yes stop_codon:yes gene_type:complete